MFVVIEIKFNDSSDTSTNSYATRAEAEAAFYQILARAATSDYKIHSAVMVTAEGYLCKSECYDRRTNEEKNQYE